MCVVTDAIAGIADLVEGFLGTSAVADTGAIAADSLGGAIATGGIDTTLDAGIGALADAGAGVAAGAGVDSLTSAIGAGSVADTGAIADAGVAAGGVGDLSAAAAPVAAGLGGAGVASAAADALPEVTVTGSALPAATGGGLAGALGPAALGAAGGALAAGAGGSPAQTNLTARDATGVDPAAAANSDSGGFLPATGPGDVNTLDPDLASSLGIDNGGGVAGGGSFLGATPTDIPDPTMASFDVSSADLAPNVDLSGAGAGNGGWESWLEKPKNLLSLGSLGISGIEGLTKPKLPSAASEALGAAGPAVAQASSIISSGGTATPIWTSQKASIDAQIDQEIQQQTQSIMQAAASNGEGNQNSGIVQQQIAQMTQNANTQRQQLYLQAQQQNVNNAVSELTGGNQTLSAIANMQLAQEEQAQAAAKQTAQLAIQLEQLSLP